MAIQGPSGAERNMTEIQRQQLTELQKLTQELHNTRASFTEAINAILDRLDKLVAK